MPILLLAEHHAATLSDATRRAATAALSLGGEVTVLIAGHNCAGAAAEAASLPGVAEVLHADADIWARARPEHLAELIASRSEGFDIILAGGTTLGRDVMPRVAALLGAPQLSDVIAIDGPKSFERAIYAGNAIETIVCEAAQCVVTVRGSAFAPAAAATSRAAVNPIAFLPRARASRFVAFDESATDRPQLGAASTIVSGGRGLGSREAFNELILPLADALGAAVGASRAAVDAGYAPNDWQVGQTGKVVAPELYLAVGISGAIQHLAGMKDSKLIVAIDKNPDAPIFSIADVAMVGDLFEIVPELTRRLASD